MDAGQGSSVNLKSYAWTARGTSRSATTMELKERKAQAGARGDRDFKAGSKIRSEERYPATQRQHCLTAFGGLAFEWDARNRLVYAEGAGLYPYWYECGYDVQGRLVYKDAPHGGDYLWDGWRETKVKRLNLKSSVEPQLRRVSAS